MRTTLLLLCALGAGCASGTSGTCNIPDAGGAAGRCSFAPKFLDCPTGSGGSETCLSASQSCPGMSTSCQDKCSASEFAASCGGPPSQLLDGGYSEPSSAAPFDGCRSLGVTPGGNAFYCCPCG